MKHPKMLFIVVALVGVGLLGTYTKSIWPRHVEQPTTVMPTKAVDGVQGIGGVVIVPPNPDTKHAGKFEQAASQTESNKTEPRPQLFEKVAPKQAAITRSVATEYIYRALRTSNDPLPQPTWVSNTTKMQAAWDAGTGSGVVVAVIDTGFALNHEDLTSQWYQNTSETGTTALGGRCWTGTAQNKTTNNCDDDNNGYHDDWRGWDFIGVNNSPQAGEANPTGVGVAHGTEVSGLIGATGNNGVGTATLSWNNKIMPLQALDDNGSGYTSGITSAVYYAVDNGAAVINLSLGGDTNDRALASAIQYAYDRGVVVVAAAGNCGTGSELGCDPTKPGAMGYPALNPYVIAVGATTSSNARASFSSYGPGIDVVAPGSGNLVSPMWTPGNQTSAYASSLYGTSFASSIVASYVGLLKSIRPGSSVDDITALVDAVTTRPAGMGSDIYNVQFGHGIIDTSTGLAVAGNLNQTPMVPELQQTGSNVSEHTYSIQSGMGSGCKGSVNSYCTIWARNSLGYDRFLPYSATGANGVAGWSWRGSWLGEGDWSLRSRSGTQRSTIPYLLSTR